jgi:hypothetical protein
MVNEMAYDRLLHRVTNLIFESSLQALFLEVDVVQDRPISQAAPCRYDPRPLNPEILNVMEMQG